MQVIRQFYSIRRHKLDSSKQPGINFDNVIIKELNFKREHIIAQPSAFSISFNQISTINDDRNNLILELNCTVSDETKSVFISATMVGFFSVDIDNKNLSLEEFSKVSAPAFLFPYIRELFASITSRAGIAPIVLPPFNVSAIVQSATSKT